MTNQTDEQMLRELIKLAIENGWEGLPFGDSDLFARVDDSTYFFSGTRMSYSVQELLFDHSFAKAIFGEEFIWVKLVDSAVQTVEKPRVKGIWVDVDIKWRQPRYRQFLQQMILLKPSERIAYAYRLRKRND